MFVNRTFNPYTPIRERHDLYWGKRDAQSDSHLINYRFHTFACSDPAPKTRLVPDTGFYVDGPEEYEDEPLPRRRKTTKTEAIIQGKARLDLHGLIICFCGNTYWERDMLHVHLNRLPRPNKHRPIRFIDTGLFTLHEYVISCATSLNLEDYPAIITVLTQTLFKTFRYHPLLNRRALD